MIDIGAEKLFTAEKENRKIAVEVKSFLSVSKMNDFYGAIGQYDVYRLFLEQLEPERKIFLAVDLKVYSDFFSRTAVKFIIEKKNISIVVIDINTEVIIQWIN